MSRPYANESAFRAIADPTRRRLIELLLREESSAVELAQVTGVSRQTLSHHLNILRTSGIIRQRRRGRSREYVVQIEPIRAAATWFKQCEMRAGSL